MFNRIIAAAAVVFVWVFSQPLVHTTLDDISLSAATSVL